MPDLSSRKERLRSVFYTGDDFGTLQQHVWAVLLGLFTALIAAAYSACLDLFIDVLWQKIPAALPAVGPAYTIAVTTLAALAVAGLGAALPQPGNMDEWVDTLHSTGLYPSEHLAPMILLSFLTAASGFSVGPEAPMVVVGSICGSAVAQAFKQSVLMARVMNLAGAAGCLSAFFGLPLAGAFFVLEFPHKLGIQYYEALSPAVIASIASSLLARQIKPQPYGGTYNYGETKASLPPNTVWLALLVGLMGSFAAVLTTLLLQLFKRMSLRLQHRLAGDGWMGLFAVRVCVGVLVGVLGTLYPQTLFWGEQNLQTAIDGQRTPLHLIGNTTLDRWGITLGPELGGWGAAQIGLSKVFAIALAGAGAFPGGIIYPLFFAGGYFGRALSCVSPHNSALVSICFMAVFQAVVTKTPMASSLILAVTASAFELGPGAAGQQAFGAVMPMLVSAVHVGLVATHPLGVGYFHNSRARCRELPAAEETPAAEESGADSSSGEDSDGSEEEIPGQTANREA